MRHRQRGDARNMSHIAAAAFALVIAPLLHIAPPATATSVNHARQQQPATKKTLAGDDPSLLEQQQQQLDQHELRRTIEDCVLKGLATSMVAHREKVERGELRRRPFVTLTYAQSIDGSIAGADKSQASRRSLVVKRDFVSRNFSRLHTRPPGGDLCPRMPDVWPANTSDSLRKCTGKASWGLLFATGIMPCG